MHNPLDSRQLANFCEIADAKSIRKAAKNLNLTTSAVSHSLKRLEDDLGCKLFERDTRSITLTYAGQRLHGLANELVGTLTKARYLVSQWGEIHQKTIRIGASPVACQHILPMALRELKESFPGMNIQILAGTSYQIAEYLSENKVDLAIYPANESENQRHRTIIGTDTLHFILNPHHPWAGLKQAKLEEIQSQRIIMTESKSYTFDLINSYFRAYKQPLNPFIEISNEEVIKRLVELDIGIGILPHWAIRNEVANGTLVSLPLGRKKLVRHWIVAHAATRDLSFAESLLVGVTQNVAQNVLAHAAD